MCAQDVVIFPQIGAHTDGDCFLPTVHVKRTHHVTEVRLAACFFLEKPNAPHIFVHGLAQFN
jgi:hypothetical protein